MPADGDTVACCALYVDALLLFLCHMTWFAFEGGMTASSADDKCGRR